jgi:hypothetical protein
MREELRARKSCNVYNHQMHQERKRHDNRESLLSKRGGRKGRKRREEKRREEPGTTPRTCVHKIGVGIGFSFLLSAPQLEVVRFLLGRFFAMSLLSSSRFFFVMR